MWYFGVFGVILYSCGMCCDSVLMVCRLKFIFVFCVVVSRCRMVLVELFIVMFSVIVFLNVVCVVMLCGSVCVFLLLYQWWYSFMIRCLVWWNSCLWLVCVVRVELLFGSDRFSVLVRQFIELVVNMFEYELQVGQVLCLYLVIFLLLVFLLVVIIIVFIRFSLCLDSCVLLVFIGLLEMNIIGMFRCSVVISMLGVILLQLEMYISVLVQCVLIMYFIELVMILWLGSEYSMLLWFIVMLLFIVIVLNFLVMLFICLILCVISWLRFFRWMCLGMNWVNELVMVMIGLWKLLLVMLVVCYRVWVLVMLWLVVDVWEWYLGMGVGRIWWVVGVCFVLILFKNCGCVCNYLFLVGDCFDRLYFEMLFIFLVLLILVVCGDEVLWSG